MLKKTRHILIYRKSSLREYSCKFKSFLQETTLYKFLTLYRNIKVHVFYHKTQTIEGIRTAVIIMRYLCSVSKLILCAEASRHDYFMSSIRKSYKYVKGSCCRDLPYFHIQLSRSEGDLATGLEFSHCKLFQNVSVCFHMCACNGYIIHILWISRLD